MKTVLKLAISALALGGLAACGVTGDLSRAEPLWGDPQDEVAPASLPEQKSDQIELPPREVTIIRPVETVEDTPPNSEDELLGGPGG